LPARLTRLPRSSFAGQVIRYERTSLSPYQQWGKLAPTREGSAMRHQGLVSILFLVACASSGHAAVLITAQASQLPRALPGGSATPASGATGCDKDRGTPTRPPDVVVQSPTGPVGSPFPLRVAFTPHNGARIDPNGVTVTLLTKPEVDLTNRIRPYLSPGGVNFAQAEAPPGQYRIRIELIDDAGHVGATTVDLQVQRP
jgi:hypothetical protein